MHEFPATQELVRIALEEGAGRRIRRIKVKIGEWAGLCPDYLEHYFPMVAEGTLAEGAHLEFVLEKLSGRCAKCGADFQPKAGVFACEVCGGTELELTAGKGLELVELEVD